MTVFSAEDFRRDELIQDRLSELYERNEVLLDCPDINHRTCDLMIRTEEEIRMLEVWSIADLHIMKLDENRDELLAHRAEEEALLVQRNPACLSVLRRHLDRLFAA